MGEFSKIEWCHHTFNPWIGCAKVSPGCTNCYAAVETFPRVQRGQGRELWGVNAERHVTADANWRKPLSWNAAAAAAGERHRVFCASMSDVGEDRPDLVEPRARLCELIRATPHLDWLLLTKRIENMARLFPEDVLLRSWVGTTTEDQLRADERIPILLQTPALIRFISAEPLLGPIDVRRWLIERPENAGGHFTVRPALDWGIAGGESGTAARPNDLAWSRSLVKQFKAMGRPLFMKQLGARPEFVEGCGDCDPCLAGQPCCVGGARIRYGLTNRKGGDIEEFPADLRVRQFPTTA